MVPIRLNQLKISLYLIFFISTTQSTGNNCTENPSQFCLTVFKKIIARRGNALSDNIFNDQARHLQRLIQSAQRFLRHSQSNWTIVSEEIFKTILCDKG